MTLATSTLTISEWKICVYLLSSSRWTSKTSSIASFTLARASSFEFPWLIAPGNSTHWTNYPPSSCGSRRTVYSIIYLLYYEICIFSPCYGDDAREWVAIFDDLPYTPGIRLIGQALQPVISPRQNARRSFMVGGRSRSGIGRNPNVR